MLATTNCYPSRERAADDMIAEEMARAMQHHARTDTVPQNDDQDPTPQRASGPIVQTSMMAHMPVELLLFIFELTQDGLYQHDPSIIQGPRSPWMIALRTRKALAFTCKAFAGPATELLYGDIVLRRMGQIPALARTLDPTHTASAGVFSQLVRSIRIDSCVVWAPFADVVREDLRSILERCNALTSFSYRPHPSFYRHTTMSHCDEDPELNAFGPEWLWGLDTDDRFTGVLQPSTLRSLRFLDLQIPDCSVSLWVALNAALDCASNMVKLRLYPEYIALDTVSRPDSARPIRLPALEDLQVHDQYGVPYAGSFVQTHICESWELPRLVALTVSGSNVPFQEAPLIHKYGPQITYLQWGTNTLSRRQILNDAHNLGMRCPRLEHLVVQGYRSHIHDSFANIVCPTLRVLDLWSPHHELGRRTSWDLRARISQMLNGGTPRLERVNVFVNLHKPSARLHWPRLSNSCTLSIANHVVWKYDGLPEIHMVWTDSTDFPTGYTPTANYNLPPNPIYNNSFSPETLGDDFSENEPDVEWPSTSEELRGDLEDDADEDDTDTMSEWSDQDYDGRSDDDLSPSGSMLARGHQSDREAILAMFSDSQEGGILDDLDERV
ncbi:hypothetical protein C8Q73DRAFT_710561 [Cubamyces lactineus]|nr:hypothetical protein C8Q73DRAFT_710561 [Cubamyces lactineus]